VALTWQIWARSRWSLALILVLGGGIVALLYGFADLVLDASASAPTVLLFGFYVLTTALVTAWERRIRVDEPYLSQWMLTLAVRTETLIGWPMLVAALLVAPAWPLWACFIMGMSPITLPLVWPACLFAASAAWFQVFLLPAHGSWLRAGRTFLVLGLLGAGTL